MRAPHTSGIRSGRLSLALILGSIATMGESEACVPLESHAQLSPADEPEGEMGACESSDWNAALLGAMAPAGAEGAADDVLPPAPLYVLMVSHFDNPAVMATSDLAAFRELTRRHPRMRWTHLFNPVAYTPPVALLPQIESYLFEARDVHGAEIGLHTHMYPGLVAAAGVQFRSAPDIVGPPPSCGADPTGYTVPITAYTEQEITAILQFSLNAFHLHGLGTPRTYCAGYYATSTTLQRVISNLGFTASAAAWPRGSVIGGQYGGCWDLLAGWDTSVTFITRPYLVSAGTILPGGPPPYLVTEHGPLLELPQVGKIDVHVSAEDMQTVFLYNYQLARAGQPTAVCLAMHEILAHSDLSKYDQVLSFIDTYLDRPDGPPVIYATATETRDALLPELLPRADLNGDYVVNTLDLGILLSSWSIPSTAPGCGGAKSCPADLNGDGFVNSLDLGILLSFWTV